MKHPQPAFDFLTALPVSPIEDIFFVDWWAKSDIDAAAGDKIADHPEAWEFIELPEVLADLSPDNYVTIQSFDGLLNLTAVAMGLGLENMQYDPEKFGSAVCRLTEYDATAILPQNTLILTIGDTPEDTYKLVDHIINKLEMLELVESKEFGAEKQTKQVSEFL